MNEESPPPFTTVGQVAKAFSISSQHVRRLVKDGQIPAVRLGRSIRIPLAAVTYENLLRFGNLRPKDVKR